MPNDKENIPKLESLILLTLEVRKALLEKNQSNRVKEETDGLSEAQLIEKIREASDNHQTQYEYVYISGIKKTNKAIFIQHLRNFLQQNPEIKKLDLSHNELGNDGLKEVAELIQNSQNLEVLYLNAIGINDAGLAFLRKMLQQEQGELKHLLLGGNQITAAGIKTMLNWLRVDNKGVENLSFSGNPIGDEGAIAIANWLKPSFMHKAPESLKSLHLSACGITDVGMKELASALEKNNSLTFFNFESNTIGKEGLNVFLNLIKTKMTLSVNLQHNNLSLDNNKILYENTVNEGTKNNLKKEIVNQSVAIATSAMDNHAYQQAREQAIEILEAFPNQTESRAILINATIKLVDQAIAEENYKSAEMYLSEALKYDADNSELSSKLEAIKADQEYLLAKRNLKRLKTKKIILERKKFVKEVNQDIHCAYVSAFDELIKTEFIFLNSIKRIKQNLELLKGEKVQRQLIKEFSDLFMVDSLFDELDGMISKANFDENVKKLAQIIKLKAFVKNYSLLAAYSHKYPAICSSIKSLIADMPIYYGSKMDMSILQNELDDVNGLIIQPIQRLPRYLLILKEIRSSYAKNATKQEQDESVIILDNILACLTNYKNYTDEAIEILAKNNKVVTPIAIYHYSLEKLGVPIDADASENQNADENNFEISHLSSDGLAALNQTTLQKTNNKELQRLQRELTNDEVALTQVDILKEEFRQLIQEMTKAANDQTEQFVQVNVDEKLNDYQNQLKALELQQAILMREFQIKQKKKQALACFKENVNLILFYKTVQIKLEELFISCKAAAGGFTQVSEGKVGKIKEGIELLGSFLELIPIFGQIAEAGLKLTAIKAVDSIDKARQINTAKEISELLTLTELKMVIENTARQLTLWYKPQIVLLATPDEERGFFAENEYLFNNDFKQKISQGITHAKQVLLNEKLQPSAKKFAEFAVYWIIEAIFTASFDKTKPLDVQFIQAVTHKTVDRHPTAYAKFLEKIKNMIKVKDNSIDHIYNEVVLSNQGNHWLILDLYTQCGMRTDDKKLFKNTHSQAEIYGYCHGDEAAAQARSLKYVAMINKDSSVKALREEAVESTKALSNEVQGIAKESKLHQEEIDLLRRQLQQEMALRSRLEFYIQNQLHVISQALLNKGILSLEDLSKVTVSNHRESVNDNVDRAKRLSTLFPPQKGNSKNASHNAKPPKDEEEPMAKKITPEYR